MHASQTHSSPWKYQAPVWSLKWFKSATYHVLLNNNHTAAVVKVDSMILTLKTFLVQNISSYESHMGIRSVRNMNGRSHCQLCMIGCIVHLQLWLLLIFNVTLATSPTTFMYLKINIIENQPFTHTHRFEDPFRFILSHIITCLHTI